jgi:hypothetical protein
MRRIPVWIKPLDLFGAVDEKSLQEDTLKIICGPDVTSDPESVRARYKEIDNVEPNLFAPPADERILSQLIWPLRHAKAAYMVGNYLGTISLAGIVGEMTAILIFDLIDNKSFNGGPWSQALEKQMFGSTFERLGQHRRIEVLGGYGVPKEIIAAFETIRVTRNKHLHLAQLLDKAKLASDARIAFRDAVTVVAAVIGQNIQDGKLMLTPQMMRYLERAGLAPQGSEQPTQDA